jgi:hypothetical protein
MEKVELRTCFEMNNEGAKYRIGGILPPTNEGLS